MLFCVNTQAQTWIDLCTNQEFNHIWNIRRWVKQLSNRVSSPLVARNSTWKVIWGMKLFTPLKVVPKVKHFNLSTKPKPILSEFLNTNPLDKLKFIKTLSKTSRSDSWNIEEYLIDYSFSLSQRWRNLDWIMRNRCDSKFSPILPVRVETSDKDCALISSSVVVTRKTCDSILSQLLPSTHFFLPSLFSPESSSTPPQYGEVHTL